MSITDFTFNNPHFQVKMVKKVKICFFSRFVNMVTTLSNKSRQIDWTRFHWIWRQKVFFCNFFSFFTTRICTKNETSQVFDPTLQWGKRFRGS